MKHLLKLLDLTDQEILDILNLADQLKYETKHGIPHPHLQGKCLGMIFEKSSTRTRVSFEVGINQLGGYAVVLGRKAPDRPGRAGPGHSPGALPVCGRHHDPHLRPGRGGGLGPVRQRARHQRPDGLLPPLPGAGGLDDHPGVQGSLEG